MTWVHGALNHRERVEGGPEREGERDGVWWRAREEMPAASER